MLDIFIILLLGLFIWLNVRNIRVGKFLKVIIRAEFAYARTLIRPEDYGKLEVKNTYPISSRLSYWRLVFSFRALTYSNYIWPQELEYLLPYLIEANDEIKEMDKL